MKHPKDQPFDKNTKYERTALLSPCFLKRIFGKGYRRDGTLAPIDYFQKFLPYIIRRRSEAIIYMDLELDMTHTLEYLESKRRDGAKEPDTIPTPFSLAVAATHRLAVEKPRMNRFVAAKRIYDRNAVEICYVIKTAMNEDGQEVVVKESFTPDETLQTITRKIYQTKSGTRNNDTGTIDSSMKLLSKMPRFMLSMCFSLLRALNWFDLVPASVLKNDALYASAFISNVGSIGSRAPFHHLFDMGTTSVFIVIGLLRSTSVLTPEGAIMKKDILDVRFSIDDRIADGFYYVKAIDLFKDYMENPEKMEKPSGQI